MWDRSFSTTDGIRLTVFNSRVLLQRTQLVAMLKQRVSEGMGECLIEAGVDGTFLIHSIEPARLLTSPLSISINQRTANQ
jgi:hypothetical protein